MLGHIQQVSSIFSPALPSIQAFLDTILTEECHTEAYLSDETPEVFWRPCS